ncbi:MAG: hypothetical protein HY789_02160 [Deltaproteobacteria bacterium]|nr:hypothetical protein [Deltaproteobacteria bacterium]
MALGYALFTNDLPFFEGKEKSEPIQTQTHSTILPKTLAEVTRKSESKLDPKAILDANSAAVQEKAEKMKDQEKTAQISEPLTDVAPPPPEVDVAARRLG